MDGLASTTDWRPPGAGNLRRSGGSTEPCALWLRRQPLFLGRHLVRASYRPSSVDGSFWLATALPYQASLPRGLRRGPDRMMSGDEHVEPVCECEGPCHKCGCAGPGDSV